MHPGFKIFRLVTLIGSLFIGLPLQAADFPLKGSSPGGFSAELTPRAGKITIGQPDEWILQLLSYNNDPAEPVLVQFDGGMRAHGHGLPEGVSVTATDEPGRYEISPVVFNMSGDWQLIVSIAGENGVEQIVFELAIGTQPEIQATDFSNAEIRLLESLSLNALDTRPDPSNGFSGNPQAAAFGSKLFFSTGLSGAGDVACSNCHQPERAFTDGLRSSVVQSPQPRNAPTLVGTAQHRWFYWDGRRDSLWSQALTPIETVGEMDSTRTQAVRFVTTDRELGPEFRKLTGSTTTFEDNQRFPERASPYGTGLVKQQWLRMSPADRLAVNRAFSDIGKLLAAFEETLQPVATRYDQFVTALTTGDTGSANKILNEAERRGLKLFIDGTKTQCLRCHNGPLLTNYGFHAIGSESNAFDLGFLLGLQAAQLDPFNCTGTFSDQRNDCPIGLMNKLDTSRYAHAFKVPTLRNLARTAPYFHDGRFETLEDVLAFYRSPPPATAEASEVTPLTLTNEELVELAAFLKTLSAED